MDTPGCASAPEDTRLGAHAFYRRLGYAVRKERKSFRKVFAR